MLLITLLLMKTVIWGSKHELSCYANWYWNNHSIEIKLIEIESSMTELDILQLIFFKCFFFLFFQHDKYSISLLWKKTYLHKLSIPLQPQSWHIIHSEDSWVVQISLPWLLPPWLTEKTNCVVQKVVI